MTPALPSPRRLLVAWALLVGLTLFSMTVGEIGAGVIGAALIAGMTLAKARLVINVYLNLRTASAAWRGLFTALVLLILALTLGAWGYTAVLG